MKSSYISSLLALIALNACSTIPKGVVAVDNFESSKYLGQWYEIARLDFRYERNLNNTTANYSMNPDGSLKVINRGYDTLKKVWKQAEGKAKFIGEDRKAMLKVSFFGPFYAGYNVIALDPEYRYALVSGKSTDYLWILSRTTTIPEDIRKEYLAKASALGYKTDELVWVKHNN